ncbi:MAG: M43 family zinc metalloprotease [Kofleriaceae bacterium]
MSLALFGLVLSTTTLATASPPRPEQRADGKVRVGDQVFDSLSDYYRSPAFQANGARCGSQPRMSPAALALPADCSLDATTINPEYNDERELVIQVVFHVIKKTDGTGAIPEALIRSQLDVLNEDFNGLAGTPGAMGNNSKIKFVLARKDPAGMPTTGINVVTNNDYFEDSGSELPNPMKLALNWDTNRYFNIYTNDAAGYLGYATFPAEDAGMPEDGVVLLHSSVGRNAPNPDYDLGRTGTHEVGHWLGLYHTFQGGCSNPGAAYTTGDLLADTAAEEDPIYTCDVEASCGVSRPIENYMAYTPDKCMTKFTPEQSNRARCSIVNYRFVNTPPTAAFTVAPDKLVLAFANTSTDAETPTTLEYLWTFGDGETSTEASPIHTYAAEGMYEVTLEVFDPGSGSSSSKQMLVVSEEGGGCCDAKSGRSTFLLCAIPLVMILRRRRATAN